MKITIWMLMFLTIVNFAYAQVVISQVYPNPVISESGGEFLQLKNVGTITVDISGWLLSTDTSVKDAVIPSGVLLRPNETYLIADSGWQESRDGNWPDADYEEAITLKNSDGGVALAFDNETIDAVGWGLSEILREGTPAGIPGEGEALVRFQDTNNNEADFEIRAPVFHIKSSKEITVSLSVIPQPLIIEYVNITDEQEDEGIQIFPNAGKVREVQVSVLVRGEPESGRMSFLEDAFELDKDYVNQTHSLLRGNLHINYSLLAGTYPLGIEVRGAQAVQKVEYVTYLPLLSFSIDKDALAFENLTPGQSAIVRGDKDMASELPTLQNSGNVPIDIGVKGGVLSKSGNYLSEILSISFGKLNSLITEMEQVLQIHLLPGNALDMSINVTVPPNASIGSYTGSIYLIGVAAE